MSENLIIPHDGVVVVGDGRKALVLRNWGHPLACDLRVEEVFNAPDNPATAEQGADRPGRAMGFDGRRSGVEQTDWHELSEQSFARDVARAVEGLIGAKRATAIILVAPAKTLAELRRALSSKTREIIVAEIAKDLTGHPVAAIQRLLVG
ncbi:MAG: host attachment protein [Microvirga sp.]|nr:host attachment protein [Microvirga sp.]